MRRLTGFAAAMTCLLGLVLVGPPSTARAFASPCQAAIASHRQLRCDQVQVFGHRAVMGPATGTNENTIAALRRDHQLGVGCETDTWRLAADDGTRSGGASVIFHDPTLGRVVSKASIVRAGLTARTDISNVTMAQFKLLRTKGGQPLPTLYSWIRHLGRWQVPCKIELKYTPGSPATVAAWVERFNAPSTFYALPQSPTSPFPCEQTAAQAMLDVGMTVGLKYNTDCPMTMDQIAAFGYSFLNYPTPTVAFVKDAHAHGLLIGETGGNTAAAWTQLVNTGLDFIIADHPGRLERWLH